MRKYGYKRPSATLYVRKRRTVRPKQPSFFFKFLVRFFLFIFVAGGLFLGGRYVWHLVAQAQLTNWHIKSVAVAGIDGPRQQEIAKQAATFVGNPFSYADAQRLEKQIAQAYPMFKEVDVSRGVFSGKLKITIQPRQAVARFVLPDHSYKYLDDTSTVYDDASGPQGLLQIELEGEVPDKLPASLVEWVEDIIKLKKSLPFEALQLTVPSATVTMHLTDQSIIRFGSADHLKEKAARAVEIMSSAKTAYQAPFVLDFTYFEQGKVFLTHSSH